MEHVRDKRIWHCMVDLKIMSTLDCAQKCVWVTFGKVAGVLQFVPLWFSVATGLLDMCCWPLEFCIGA